MFILARYVIREHIGPFLFAFTLIASMLILNFVLQAMRYIIGKGITFQIIIEFIAYNLAGIIVLVVPMAILVATIMAFGRFASDNEITAVKAGGINFLRLLFPVLMTAVFVTAGVFWFNDQVLPVANHNARVLKKNIQAKRPTLSIEPGVYLEGVDDFSMIVENKDELSSVLYGVTLFDKSSRSSHRTIIASKGQLEIDEEGESMILTLENGEIHEFNPTKRENYQKVIFTRYKVIVPVDNLSLKKSDETFRNDREKTIDQLMEEVARHKKEKDRQMSLALTNLGKHPEVAAFLDTRSRTILNRSFADRAVWDDIDRIFTTFNLGRTGFVASADSSEALVNWAQVRRFLRDTTKPSVESGSGLLSPEKLKERTLPFRGDSGVVPVATLGSQTGSYLNTAASYQRLMDQCMVEVNKKYSIPLACVVFVLLGAPIGVKARRGNLGLAGGISLFFFIAYYFCLILGEDLADRQLMNPFFAMWSMNIILGGLGCILVYQTVTERNFGLFSFFRLIVDVVKNRLIPKKKV